MFSLRRCRAKGMWYAMGIVVLACLLQMCPAAAAAAAAARAPPLAMSLGNNPVSRFFAKFWKGTTDLWDDAQVLQKIKKRYQSGEPLSFEEYNVMHRTSGDVAKAAGTVLFLMTKPELWILISYFPSVIPTTYFDENDKLQQLHQKSFKRVKSSITHLMKLQETVLADVRGKNQKARDTLSCLEDLLRENQKGTAQAVKRADAVLYSEEKKAFDKKGKPMADLTKVPRPYLVNVCNSIGMWHSFVPAFALRLVLGDYLDKVREGDEILLRSNLAQIRHDDLITACTQRGLSVGDLSDSTLKNNLSKYLKQVSTPAVPKTKDDLCLNENNLRFTLIGLNGVTAIRETGENLAMQILFGLRS